MKSGTVHIGVDVSKEKLDIYVPAKKEGSRPLTKEVDNDINGFRELRNLARKAKATVCVEPTGGYELELIAFMHKFDVPVAYTDALRVRQFARAEGNLSKNDAIDAALISRFADKIGVRVLEAQEVEAVELKRKAKFRQTMVDSRTAMINRLETEIDPEMKALPKGKDVRNALYMAAVASIKWNAILGGYYRKKRAEGHPHKWAIVPTMRKLLSLLNRIARDPGFIPMPEPESTKQNANVGRKKKAA